MAFSFFKAVFVKGNEEKMKLPLNRLGRIPCEILSRKFSSRTSLMSNIGKQPVVLAEGVSCFAEDLPLEFCKRFSKGKTSVFLNKQIVVKGPRGILRSIVPGFVQLKVEDNAASIVVEDTEDKFQRSMWGTARSILDNSVVGASEGHLSIVKFVGTGYRATIEDGPEGKKYVALRIGFPYIPKLEVPDGLTVSLPNPTRLIIEGLDKQKVKLFAARIREHKKPEPYKGKGIFVDNETITLKEKKVK